MQHWVFQGLFTSRDLYSIQVTSLKPSKIHVNHVFWFWIWGRRRCLNRSNACSQVGLLSPALRFSKSRTIIAQCPQTSLKCRLHLCARTNWPLVWKPILRKCAQKQQLYFWWQHLSLAWGLTTECLAQSKVLYVLTDCVCEHCSVKNMFNPVKTLNAISCSSTFFSFYVPNANSFKHPRQDSVKLHGEIWVPKFVSPLMWYGEAEHP